MKRLIVVHDLLRISVVIGPGKYFPSPWRPCCELSMWGSCLSTVRAIGCGCWFTNAAIYTLCFQHDSSLSGDMRPEKMAPYIGAAVLRQLPHLSEYRCF